jgi:hypothetical protein
MRRYDVRFVLDQHAELDFYSASSLKQQSAVRNFSQWKISAILLPMNIYQDSASIGMVFS